MTSVGSTPNYYPCDTKDSDQQMIVRGDDIFHAATGLLLNLGDRNDTPVVWKNPSNSITTTSLPKNTNPKTNFKTQTINACPEIKRQEIRKSGDYFQIDHANSCGKFYTYLNRQAIVHKNADAKNIGIAAGTIGGMGGYAATLGVEFFSGYGIPVGIATLITGSYAAVTSNQLEKCINTNASGAWVNIYIGPASYETLSITPSIEVSCTY